MERSRIDPISVGFYLAPRINAANRMASPRMAYDLITATDADTATELASQLSKHNEARQQLVADRFEAIVREVGATVVIRDDVRSGKIPPVLLVRGDWPSGISGLLATRLVER